MSGPDKEQNTPVSGHDHVHSHHHGHREHHHRSRQRKKRRSSNKVLNFLVEHKNQLAGVAVFLAILVVLIVLIFKEAEAGQRAQGDLPEGTGVTTPPPQQVELTDLTVRLPWMPEAVPVTGGAVRALMSADSSVPARDVLETFREANDRLDVGVPVELSFDVLSLPQKEKIDHFRVDVWKEGDRDGLRSFELKASKRSLELTCLETGAAYRYEITVFLTGGTEHTIGGSFTTEVSPRVLSVAGIRNVRDIGGWTTADGRILRQGLLYRGTELDGAVEDYLKLTDTGRQDMLSRLGIRSDLDLRASGTGFNALGASVRHTYFDMASYDGIFSGEGKEPVRQLFGTLADPDAYPVYLHGTHGIARTGTVCYLLQALLGMSEEDLIREYELSALTYETVGREQIMPMVDVLKTYGGKDMAENVELYLKSIGVTQAEIDQIRQIWLY